MPELDERPKPRRVTAEVEFEKGKKIVRSGVSLEDIVRAILWDLKAEHGWSTAQLGRHIGIRQSVLNQHLDMDRKLPLWAVSKVCAALKLTPVQLFQRHERYQAPAEFAEDAIYSELRGVLEPQEVRPLVALLYRLKERGEFESTLALMGSPVPVLRSVDSPESTGKSAQKRKRRQAKPPRR